jgi:hypothetical protein
MQSRRNISEGNAAYSTWKASAKGVQAATWLLTVYMVAAQGRPGGCSESTWWLLRVHMVAAQSLHHTDSMRQFVKMGKSKKREITH